MDKQKSTAGTVLAGFGTADITPWEGVHLGGAAYGEYRPARFVRHKLYAKASVYRDAGGSTVCIIGLDTICIKKPYADQIKQAIMEEFGLPYGAIMVFAIQSHSAPSVGPIMLDDDFPPLGEGYDYLTGHDPRYSQFATEQSIRAARDAFANLRPLKMDAKSGMKHGLAFCRRIIMRDGTMEMFPPHRAKEQPLGPDIRCLESDADDEVGVVVFKDENMNFAGGMLHFTCHPVNDYCTASLYHAVSPDWCGTWSERVQKMMGMDQIPAVLNGCCGNVNPWNPHVPDHIMDSEDMGEALAKLTERIILSMDFENAGEPLTVDHYYMELPVEYREIPAERLAEVEKQMKKGLRVGKDSEGNILDDATWNPGGRARSSNDDMIADQDWFLAASTQSALLCKQREPLFPYPIQVFRIGNIAIVGMAGEPFTDGGFDIKLRSKAALTYITHMANRYVGYLPKASGYDYDAHESNFAYTNWAKLKRGSLEKICDAIVEGIDKLFEV